MFGRRNKTNVQHKHVRANKMCLEIKKIDSIHTYRIMYEMREDGN